MELSNKNPWSRKSKQTAGKEYSIHKTPQAFLPTKFRHN
jgi:hypothetical protein